MKKVLKYFIFLLKVSYELLKRRFEHLYNKKAEDIILGFFDTCVL